MNIGSVNNYGVMQNYKIPSVPAGEPEKKIVAESPVSDMHDNPSIKPSAAIPVNAAVESSNTPEGASVRKDAQLEDISLTFNLQEEFGYLGQDSDIRSLDMEQAISDMKKDQVLQQYQYFVGRSQNLLTESADGAVFVKF